MNATHLTFTRVASVTLLNRWQNGGHSGCDQWNFVMHPVFAAKKCDPEGHYVSQWLPELAGLPMEYVHCPWEAPREALAAARLSFVRGNSIKRGVSVGVAAGSGGGSSGGSGVGRGSKSVSTPAHTYPERLIKDLDQARQRCHDAVMAVRRSPEGLSCMLPCGNETLTLHDGRVARLITRSDYFGCVCRERGGERGRERQRETERARERERQREKSIVVRTRSPPLSRTYTVYDLLCTRYLVAEDTKQYSPHVYSL
jgi:hypothetical protein